MIDTKKNRNVMSCIVQYGQSRMNCAEQLMDGISKIMFWVRCFIVIFQKICVIM